MTYLKHLPLVSSGLSLALFGLSQLASQHFPAYQPLFLGFAVLLWLAIWGKILFFPEQVKLELRHPMVAGAFATFFMAGQAWLQHLNHSWLKTISFSLLASGFLIYTVYFTVRFVGQRRLELVYPTWFVPYVGLAIIAPTAKQIGLAGLSQFFFYFPLFAYLILLAVISYRVRRLPLTTAERPSLAIYGAAPSLLLAVYLLVSPAYLSALVIFLVLVAQVSYLFLLWTLWRVRQDRLSPVFLAFSFPSVISARAFSIYQTVLHQNQFLLKLISQLEIYMALAIIAFLSIYLIFFLREKVAVAVSS